MQYSIIRCFGGMEKTRIAVLTCLAKPDMLQEKMRRCITGSVLEKEIRRRKRKKVKVRAREDMRERRERREKGKQA